MRKLTVFNQVSVDGYFKSSSGEMGWAHEQRDDPEFREFTAENASGGGVMVFGRTTYEMMAAFWPTPAAAKQFPVVAEQMTRMQKIVFSKTLDRVTWSNTKLVKGNPATELRRMKNEPGEPLVVLGSGTIVSQLAQADLVDEYQLVVIPVVLGEGTTMFEGSKKKLPLQLIRSRTFRNGNAFLVYQPKA